MKRSIVSVSLCALFGLFLVVPCAPAQDGILLRYKMKKGEKRVYRKAHEMNQIQEVGDRKVNSKITQTDMSEWTLDKIDKKGNFYFRTQNKLYQASFSVSLGKKNIIDYKYDSKKDENDSTSMFGAALTPLYDALSGAMFKVVVTPTGKVKKVKGFVEQIEGVLKKNPLANQFMPGGKMAGVTQYQGMFLDLPKKKVRAGDTWSVPYTFDLPQVGKVTAKNLYAFDGMVTRNKQKLAKISMSSEMSIDVKLKNDAGTFEGTLMITDSKGVGYFDPKTGNVVSVTNQFTISGALNGTINGQDLTINQNQKHKLRLELVK